MARKASKSKPYPTNDFSKKVASSESATARWIGFGIPFLDELLGVNPNFGSKDLGNPGLPAGDVTALIGDTGTHRRRLGRAFLAGCFDERQLQGIGVLLTLSTYRQDALATKMHLHRGVTMEALSNRQPAMTDVRKQLIYRKLELHDVSSAVFVHIVQCAVEESKRRLQSLDVFQSIKLASDIPGNLQLDRSSHREEYQRIRVVIDDWSTLAAVYPDLAADPLVLPYVIDYLRDQGVTTLLIDHHAGGPRAKLSGNQQRDLHALTRHHIYTWRVPFYGEERIAISAVPPLSDLFPAHTRELRMSHRRDDESLWVDPHFEIYAGLERTEPLPIPVPLQLRMYAKTDAFMKYATKLNTLFSEPFVPRPDHQFVFADGSDQYETLRHFTHVQSDTRLDYTLVFEVDEFWMQRSSRTELMDLKKYLLAETDERPRSVSSKESTAQAGTDSVSAVNDPFQQFRGQAWRSDKSTEKTKPYRRYEYFTLRGYNWADYIAPKKEKGRQPLPSLDRVPFMWDFGFLMLDRRAWECARDAKLGDDKTTVADLRNIFEKRPNDKYINWCDFLEACKVVAEKASGTSQIARAPFDLDMRATEALSCLVLEMWFSDVHCTSGKKILKQYTTRSLWSNSNPQGFGQRFDLTQLIEHYGKELYRVFLLLGEVMDSSELRQADASVRSRSVCTNAVAARHWYSTATTLESGSNTVDWIPVCLPGHFSARGDWYLALAKGSRSERVGWHAIDLLTSMRENVYRLQAGLGLPTRDYLPHAEKDGLSKQFSTALKLWDLEANRYSEMNYGDLTRRLGANSFGEPTGFPTDFHWLFRSTIRRYSSQSRVWAKWLARVLTRWNTWRINDSPVKSGFEMYRQLSRREDPTTESWQTFKDECEYVVAALKSASHAP